ncbi:porin, partial [Escherichia coli]
YHFTDNFNAYVDYKINLLDEDGSDGYSKLGQVSDDVVGVALQYNF